MATGILERRRSECPDEPRPIIIWEPVPDLCIPQELANCREALKFVDVVSPNHEELRAFYDEPRFAEPGFCITFDDGEVNKGAVETFALGFLNMGHDGLSVVVRCGKAGCYAVQRKVSVWVPAYFGDPESKRVVDPTGGGNAFLGGLGIALATGEDLAHAAISGSIAASFAIEQVGVPTLSMGEDGTERWNRESVMNRRKTLQGRGIRP
jgi:sugar/nucleoside kinase (ribokinase family)